LRVAMIPSRAAVPRALLMRLLSLSALGFSAAWLLRLRRWYRSKYEPGAFTGWIAKRLAQHSEQRKRTRPIRVYMDGCFDLMHFGHANALRQARACGDVLVVGVVNDAEIRRCKGPPVMTEEERVAAVSAVKWVDEVIPDVPYDVSAEFTQELFDKYRIDYIVHGDDPCLLPDGTDAYAAAKKLGRFKMIKRTEGVSSTDIVGRMLLSTRAQPEPEWSDKPSPLQKKMSVGDSYDNLPAHSASQEEQTTPSTSGAATVSSTSKKTQLSHFCPTSRRIMQFSNCRAPGPNDRIVYVPGVFDMFHAGHIDALKAARELGDFILVGIHSDEVVTETRGPHHPILNLHERSLSVLSCKFVDEVIIGAPLVVTHDMVKTFNISVVVHCPSAEGPGSNVDPFAVPKELGIYREVKSLRKLTTADITQRIVQNLEQFEARQARKTVSEAKYYANKTHVEEVGAA